MSREMLGASEHAFRLAGVDPSRRVLTNSLRIASERPGADDGIVGLDVEIAVGRVNPIDTELAGLARRHPGSAAHRLQIFERSNGRQWWQRGLPGELLSRSPRRSAPISNAAFDFECRSSV